MAFIAVTYISFLLVAFATAVPFDVWRSKKPFCPALDLPEWAKDLGGPENRPSYGFGPVHLGGGAPKLKNIYLVLGKQTWQCVKGEQPVRVSMEGEVYDVGQQYMEVPDFVDFIHSEKVYEVGHVLKSVGFAFPSRTHNPSAELWKFKDPSIPPSFLIERQLATPPKTAGPASISPVPWASMELTSDMSSRGQPSVWRVHTQGSLPAGICVASFNKRFPYSAVYFFYERVKGSTEELDCRVE